MVGLCCGVIHAWSLCSGVGVAPLLRDGFCGVSSTQPNTLLVSNLVLGCDLEIFSKTLSVMIVWICCVPTLPVKRFGLCCFWG